MLQTIERYDGATWETVTEVQLVDAKVTAINLLYYSHQTFVLLTPQQSLPHLVLQWL